MQTVVLQYVSDNGLSTIAQSFDCFKVSYLDAEFEKILHRRLNGGWVEDNIGYRMRTQIDFAPLKGDKTLLFFLYNFLKAKERFVVGDFGTRQVSLASEDCMFEFLESFRYGDAFKLDLIDRRINTISDDGNARVLKVYEHPVDSTDGNYFVSMTDENSIYLAKKALKHPGGNRSDVTVGYGHRIMIDFGFVPLSKISWLRDFCLWGVKQIDTTGWDSVNGTVYNVVLKDSSLNWTFINGLRDTLTTKLVFEEKIPHFITEIPPAEIIDLSSILIADEGEADSKVAE